MDDPKHRKDDNREERRSDAKGSDEDQGKDDRVRDAVKQGGEPEGRKGEEGPTVDAQQEEISRRVQMPEDGEDMEQEVPADE